MAYLQQSHVNSSVSKGNTSLSKANTSLSKGSTSLTKSKPIKQVPHWVLGMCGWLAHWLRVVCRISQGTTERTLSWVLLPQQQQSTYF